MGSLHWQNICPIIPVPGRHRGKHLTSNSQDLLFCCWDSVCQQAVTLTSLSLISRHHKTLLVTLGSERHYCPCSSSLTPQSWFMAFCSGPRSPLKKFTGAWSLCPTQNHNASSSFSRSKLGHKSLMCRPPLVPNLSYWSNTFLLAGTVTIFTRKLK